MNRDLSMRFEFPTAWYHGRGRASESGKVLDELGCKNTLLLTDKLLMDVGVLGPVIESLDAEGIEYDLCDEVCAEPTVKFFQGLVGKLELTKYDSVLAVGGGSVIDVAKGLAVVAQFGGHIRDYGGMDKVPETLNRKIVAVPTTSGTGSEISDGIVMIDEEAQSKFLVLSTRICPAVAITDPVMTMTMPPKVTANSGVDALTHAVESYLSRDASVLSEVISLKAIELISSGLKRAYLDGNDIDARESVQIGSTMAMVAGMNAHMGLCHAMAMPLCALYHVPHGQACGMVLPHVLSFNGEVLGEKVSRVLKSMKSIEGDSDAVRGDMDRYEGLRDFLEQLRVSARLSALGYKADHMGTIVQETLKSVQCRFNPREPSEEDVARLVKRII